MIVEKVRSEKNPNIGYNAVTENFEDLVAAGIIDPAKVTRCALQNAASIAGLMLTTEALISELQQDDKPRGHARRHGHVVPSQIGGPPCSAKVSQASQCEA